MYLALASGITKYRRFQDEQIMWSPKNNPSIEAKKRSIEMFTDDGGFIGALFEVKNPMRENML